ncbi:N-acetyl-D-Glu racemase DgcA [Ancylobacter lacus]|uniref:N-acetyl-D-Glu racemase DgcA n=1 Tax=Ancylobacter lacus TaxID=2579970 RepID=UPI001BCE5F96|nr:N-acetyl-D-Glu racemase DgcA [Ancylobacter lacus]MBS7538655.1 L-Ala-D/L-Glu epimerase [Ancylobacter lacus]
MPNHSQRPRGRAVPSLDVRIERFPIAGTFTIARGSKTEAVVVVARIEADGVVGRGECVPYARYGESVEAVAAAIEALAPAVRQGLDREALQSRLPPGAARNALDCALWDLEAKTAGRPAHELAGLPAPGAVTTAYTISLGTPEAMAIAAAAARRPLLKLKLGAPGDPARLAAIRAAVPDAELVVDANEGWAADTLAANLDACAEHGVTLVEQPLPAGDDAALAAMARPVPICADESVHGLDSLHRLVGRYDVVNVKLDKTGGLTEALALAEAAERLGLGIMVGCMVATSLAMAPAMLLTPRARVVDLDGPLLLARDRAPGLRYEGSTVFPPEPALWG